MQSNDDKYLNSYNNNTKDSFKIPDNRLQYGNEPQDVNNMGSYDSYKNQTNLSKKIGSIMEGVDKMQSTIEKQDG